MHNGKKTALILVAIAGVAAVVYLGLSPNHAIERPSVPATTSPSVTVTASGESTVGAAQHGGRRRSESVRVAISEIQLSRDLGAAYAKYRAYEDPSGEIAYRLHLALDDCIHFVDKSVDQISREMNSVGKVAVQSVPRRLAIERQIQRCRGLGDASSVLQAARDQFRRSAERGSPWAGASNLVVRAISEKSEQLDEEAIRLLSANVDDAVIHGIYNYLSSRNGEAFLSQFGDPVVTTAAWALLECNYGAPCDDGSPFVSFACIYHAACDQHDVESALPFVYPSLTPAGLQEAIRVQSLLAMYIQSRDWVRLGLSKKQGTNPQQ